MRHYRVFRKLFSYSSDCVIAKVIVLEDGETVLGFGWELVWQGMASSKEDAVEAR